MKAYPVLTFNIENDGNGFSELYNLTELHRKFKGDYLHNMYIKETRSFLNSIRKSMLESDNEELHKYADNYLSIYFNNDSLATIIIYDAKKKDNRHLNIYYDELDNGRFRPYIVVED